MRLSRTVFEILSLIFQKIKRSRDSNHAPFRDNLSSVGWDLLCSTHILSLKCLRLPATKKWRATPNVKILVLSHPLGDLGVKPTSFTNPSHLSFTFSPWLPPRTIIQAVSSEQLWFCFYSLYFVVFFGTVRWIIVFERAYISTLYRTVAMVDRNRPNYWQWKTLPSSVTGPSCNSRRLELHSSRSHGCRLRSPRRNWRQCDSSVRLV